MGKRVLILAVLLSSGCVRMWKAKPKAEAAVTHFHDTYNIGAVEALWSGADDKLRAATPHDRFLELIQSMQRDLGKVKSTKNSGWNVNELNGAVRVQLVQDTQFEKGTGRETFTYVMQGDRASLVGYFINSASLR